MTICFYNQNFSFVSSLCILKISVIECECLSVVLASFKHVSCFARLRQIHKSLVSLSLGETLFFSCRVDKSGKHFTGALCGLGWSETSGAPLLPENDMEVTFDVHFGLEDITEVKLA